MSLILCPECQTKISDKAKTCPHCGYTSFDASLPISVQETYEPLPVFEYEMQEWGQESHTGIVLAPEDNRTLVSYLGNWEFLQRHLPAIADVIKELRAKDPVLVADIPAYIKAMIKTGEYHLTYDKEGGLLAVIRDKQGNFVKQLRLKEQELPGNLTTSMGNLAVQAAMSQIIEQIESLGEAIQYLHLEMQNDRLAIAESARDKLHQAMRIQDARLREIALLDVTSTATEAKCVLMRNFTQNMQYIADHSNKSFFELLSERKIGDLFGSKDVAQKAKEAMEALVAITNLVRIECEGYTALGEPNAGRACLMEFRSFVVNNQLEQRDTLLLVNENLEEKKESLVDDFCVIASRIQALDETIALGQNPLALLCSTKETEDDE